MPPKGARVKSVAESPTKKKLYKGGEEETLSQPEQAPPPFTPQEEPTDDDEERDDVSEDASSGYCYNPSGVPSAEDITKLAVKKSKSAY